MKFSISENKELTLENQIKEEREQDNSESPNGRTSPLVSQNNEQGSTLRDLLTTTAGKLRVGSTDAGIAFAPVYSMGAPVSDARFLVLMWALNRDDLETWFLALNYPIC